MVLDTAAFDDSPTSDYDPYGSNTGGQSQTPQSSQSLRIDLAKAYRPFPILGPLTGFTNAHIVKLASGIARNAPGVLQRPITQDELDGTVAAVSRYQQVHSWVYCNALIIGGFRAANTKPEMKFPGQNWLEKKNIRFVLDFEKLGPLKGPAARVGWNAIRTSIWLAWWGLPAYILGGLFGQMAMIQIQLNDPRLKQMSKDMQTDGAKRRVEEYQKRKTSGLPPQTVQQERTDMDDMSPQAMETPVSLDRGQDVRTSGMEQYMRSSPKEPAPQSSTGSRQMGDERDRFQAQPEPSQSPFDAGPQQGSSPSGEGGSAWDRVRNSAGQRESAWDRVRRQGSSADNSSSSGSWSSRSETGNNVPLTDSFMFDQRDEDKQLARAEAQKDFNARIERERQGQDFTDSKGGRW